MTWSRSLLRHQSVRFLIVGGFGTITDAAGFLVLSLGGMIPGFANILSYSSSAAIGFWLHRHWTFDACHRRVTRQALGFGGVVLAGLCLSTALVWILAPNTGPMPAKLVAIAATLVLNFHLSRRLAFRD